MLSTLSQYLSQKAEHLLTTLDKKRLYQKREKKTVPANHKRRAIEDTYFRHAVV